MLNALEACHRLALSEGQKENNRFGKGMIVVIKEFGKKLLKRKHLIWLILMAFVAYEVLITYETVGQLGGSTVYVDDLPATATYVIKTDGTWVWAVRYDGKIVSNQTDARAVIQYAIDASTDGGTVFVKRGIYDMINGLYVKYKVKLIGEGYENTILNFQNASVLGVGLYQDYSEVRDISVNCAGTGSLGVNQGWAGVNYAKVLNCRISNWEVGINIREGTKNEFSGNIVENSSSVGIYVLQISDSIISNNVVTESNGHGIAVRSSKNIVVEGNVVRNWAKTTSWYDGIVVVNTEDNSENIAIIGNTLVGGDFATSYHGIVLTAEGSPTYYIRRVSITGNTLIGILGKSGVGIYLHEYATKHNVQDVVISSNTAEGFGSGYQFASGEEIDLIGNVAKNVQIGVWSSSPYRTKIMNNILVGAGTGTNDWDGIRLNGGNEVDVMGNCINNFYSGITETYDGYQNGDYNNIQLNRIENVGPGGAIEKAGIHTVVKNNLGFATENSGTATIPKTKTSISFLHNLSGVPTIVTYSWTDNIGTRSSWWVANQTHITVYISSSDNKNNHTLSWYAEYTP